MSLTDDARLVVEIENHPDWAELTEWGKAAVRIATAYIEAGRGEGGGCPRCGEPAREDEAGLTRWKCGCYLRRKDNVPVCSMKCQENQIENLTARLATVSADLAEHKRRLGEQSALLNAVRQERDNAIEDAIALISDFAAAVRNEHNDGLKVHHSVRVKMCLHNADAAVKYYEELKRKAGCE